MSTVTTSAPRSQAFPDLIPGVLLAGSASLFAGAQRVGKTTMLAQWIAAWQTGGLICGHQTNRPTEICYLAADRPFELHQMLFAKAGCQPMRHYSLIDDRSVTIDHLIGRRMTGDQLLDIALRALNPMPGGLLIIDPLAPFYLMGSALESRAVAATMVHLGRLAEARQITIISLMHFVKQKGGKQENYARPMDRMSGSGSFAGFSATQMWLLPPDPEAKPKQPYFTVGWNPPNGPEEEFLFARDLWGLFQPASGSPTSSGAPIPKTMNPPRIEEFLDFIGQSGDAGLKTTDAQGLFCALHRISRATFFRVLQILHSQGKIEYPKRGWVRRRK